MMAPHTPPPDWPLPGNDSDVDEPSDGDNAKSPRPETSVGDTQTSEDDEDSGSTGGGSDDGNGTDDDVEPTGGVAAGIGSTVGQLNLALVLFGLGFLAAGTGLFVGLRTRARRRQHAR